MLSLILVILLLILFISIKKNVDTCFIIIQSLLFIVLLFIELYIVACLVNDKTLDDKISIYEEYNVKIEENVDSIIHNYLEHEKYILGSMKINADNSSLDSSGMNSKISQKSLNMYPEFNSQKLVEQQLYNYIENEQTIVSLKRQKLNENNCRWLLYFGK